MVSGAGEGNRTLVMSLGSSGNAIIRRPLRGAFLPEGLGEMKGAAGLFLAGGRKGLRFERSRARSVVDTGQVPVLGPA